MTPLLQTLISLALIWVMAYRRARMYTILAVLVAALTLMAYYSQVAWLPWLVLVVVAFFYFAPVLRRRWLSEPVFAFFKRVLPPMSDTELEALEAGDVWWEAELFKGNPDWKEMLAFPKPTLTAEEQAFIDNETETLCSARTCPRKPGST